MPDRPLLRLELWTLPEPPIVEPETPRTQDKEGYLSRKGSRIPGEKEVTVEFVSDRKPDKCDRLVGRLLFGKRCADPWVGYWEDVPIDDPGTQGTIFTQSQSDYHDYSPSCLPKKIHRHLEWGINGGSLVVRSAITYDIGFLDVYNEAENLSTHSSRCNATRHN